MVALAGGLGLVALLAGLAAGGYWALKDRLFPLPVVKTDSVRIMTLGQARTELTATGYLESRRQAKIGARAPGRIETLSVEEGTRVTKGQVLASLEHADLDAALAATKAEVSRTRAEIVEQQTHAHAAVGRAEQTVEKNLACQVLIPDEILHIEAALRRIREGQSRGQGVAPVRERVEAGLARMRGDA